MELPRILKCSPATRLMLTSACCLAVVLSVCSAQNVNRVGNSPAQFGPADQDTEMQLPLVRSASRRSAIGGPPLGRTRFGNFRSSQPHPGQSGTQRPQPLRSQPVRQSVQSRDTTRPPTAERQPVSPGGNPHSTTSSTSIQRQLSGPTPNARTASAAAARFTAKPANDRVGSREDWWHPVIGQSLRPSAQPMRISQEELLVRALVHSTQVRVFSELPLIRETSIIEADSAFDWYAFIDTRWDDRNEPVGNELTTGGPNRYADHNLSGSSGLRRRTRWGGQLELSQKMGWQDTNSIYFTPAPQGTSRLSLSYTHPVLRGSGKVYNQSLTVLAKIDSGIARDEVSRQLQSHLLETIRGYWSLYLERGSYIQKLRSYERAQGILARLKQRQAIDAFESQIISAEAEVENRRSELRRAQMAVRNGEARIRALVNDPQLGSFEQVELIPVDSPNSNDPGIDMHISMALALQHRPEVNQALKQIKAACVRLDMSKNEMLPALNLVTETYAAGLQDNGRVDQSLGRQFDTGGPSYAVGLQFEVPLGNRSGKARHLRRQLELRQLQNQYRTTLETLKLEVEVAIREVDTSFTELDAKRRAMQAMQAKLDYTEKRWQLLPGENKSSSFILEDLLIAQLRLAQAEAQYLQSIVTFNLALMNVQRATGLLLQQEQIVTTRASEGGVPVLFHDKPVLPSATGQMGQQYAVPTDPETEHAPGPGGHTEGPRLQTVPAQPGTPPLSPYERPVEPQPAPQPAPTTDGRAPFNRPALPQPQARRTRSNRSGNSYNGLIVPADGLEPAEDSRP